MRTLTVKLYNSDDFGYLGDMINIAGIIYNTALTIIQDHYNETGKLLDKYELQKQLRDLRNADENRPDISTDTGIPMTDSWNRSKSRP